MVRLCTKKLLSFLGCTALYFVAYYLSFVSWINILRLITQNEVVQLLALLLVPLLIVWLAVILGRRGKTHLRRIYVAARREDPRHNTNLRLLLRSDHYRAELITFGTLVLIFTAIFSLFLSDAPWSADLLPASILFIEATVVFAVLDGLNWLAVFRHWQKDMI